MPKREPEFYEPSSAEEIRVFDGAEEDLDEEGSRLPLLLVVALIIVFAFGAVVWFAYTQGVQNGRSGAPQLIAAAPGPVRTAPAHPGGVTPYEGLKIYEHPASGSSAGTQSAQTAPSAPGPTASLPASRVATARPQALTKLVPPPVTKRVAAVSRAKPAAELRAKTTSVSLPARSMKFAQHAATLSLAKAPSLAHAKVAGPWALQIGAYKSQDQAEAAWRIYAHRHAAAASLAHDILRVDLGAKGVWYRLHIGSYATRIDATRACNRLKADGAACFPAKG
ncbi:MAG: SPOR domain-containing protein [Rhizomicrobium sp.]